MRHIVQKEVSRFGNAFRGFKKAYKLDDHFRYEVIFGGIFFLAFGYWLWPLAPHVFLFLALAYALVLITELVNTAFERALERLHPERHELIGVSKDIAAAAVLLSGAFALLVLGIIAANHFLS